MSAADRAGVGDFVIHPRLQELGVAHGFGLRGSPPLPGLLRPRQVHGRVVARVRDPERALGEADAVVTAAPGLRVGIATADCLPLLVAADAGRAVAAVHAGWRGLARGVIEAALTALGDEAGPGAALVAVVGPHVGPCCYEVDDPVLTALEERFGAGLEAALRPSRPGHARLDLAHLARCELARCGVSPGSFGVVPNSCTSCDAERYHSYRRDGDRAGRLLHWICSRDRGVDTPGGPP